MTLNLWEESSLAGALKDEATRDALRIVLETRFGVVEDDAQEAINGADETALKQLLRHAVADSREAFRARLGLAVPMPLNIWEESSLKDALADLARENSEREALLLVLEGRFSTVQDDVRKAIDLADETTLKELLRHAGTDTGDQLRARLGLE